MEIERLVQQAVNGSKSALEGITIAIQDNIYYLSLRMLANPDDAKDATQDILIKVITNLSSFRFDSHFNTWVYRIASNYLISANKIVKRDAGLTFELFRMDLEQDLQAPAKLTDNPDYQAQLNELRISCTMAMLLCLNLPHRMAYILGDILEMTHDEASSILSISKSNFRQQLSRARKKIIEFTNESCGLINKCANCSCEKKLTGAIKRQRVIPLKLNLQAGSDFSYIAVKEVLLQTQQELKTLKLQKSVSQYKCPNELNDIIELVVKQGVKANKTQYNAD
jgi:RNA polymerase sigma factor (sigma-70 family)